MVSDGLYASFGVFKHILIVFGWGAVGRQPLQSKVFGVLKGHPKVYVVGGVFEPVVILTLAWFEQGSKQHSVPP